FADLVGADLDAARQPGEQVTSAQRDALRVPVAGIGRTDRDLDVLGRPLAEEQVVLAPSECDDVLVHLVAADPDRAGDDATTDGSLMTIPRSRTWTRVFAVPRSIPMSREKRPRKRSSMTAGGSFAVWWVRSNAAAPRRAMAGSRARVSGGEARPVYPRHPITPPPVRPEPGRVAVEPVRRMPPGRSAA